MNFDFGLSKEQIEYINTISPNNGIGVLKKFDQNLFKKQKDHFQEILNKNENLHREYARLRNITNDFSLNFNEEQNVADIKRDEISFLNECKNIINKINSIDEDCIPDDFNEYREWSSCNSRIVQEHLTIIDKYLQIVGIEDGLISEAGTIARKTADSSLFSSFSKRDRAENCIKNINEWLDNYAKYKEDYAETDQSLQNVSIQRRNKLLDYKNSFLRCKDLYNSYANVNIVFKTIEKLFRRFASDFGEKERVILESSNNFINSETSDWITLFIEKHDEEISKINDSYSKLNENLISQYDDCNIVNKYNLIKEWQKYYEEQIERSNADKRVNKTISIFAIIGNVAMVLAPIVCMIIGCASWSFYGIWSACEVVLVTFLSVFVEKTWKTEIFPFWYIPLMCFYNTGFVLPFAILVQMGSSWWLLPFAASVAIVLIMLVLFINKRGLSLFSVWFGVILTVGFNALTSIIYYCATWQENMWAIFAYVGGAIWGVIHGVFKFAMLFLGAGFWWPTLYETCGVMPSVINISFFFLLAMIIVGLVKAGQERDYQ